MPLLEQSIKAKPESAVINWVWLACAEERQGHGDAAREWLAKAVAWLNQDQGKKPGGCHLHDWLEAQVLCREADAALGGAEQDSGP